MSHFAQLAICQIRSELYLGLLLRVERIISHFNKICTVSKDCPILKQILYAAVTLIWRLCIHAGTVFKTNSRFPSSLQTLHLSQLYKNTREHRLNHFPSCHAMNTTPLVPNI